MTCTAGVIATPADVVLGCTVNASWLGLPGRAVAANGTGEPANPETLAAWVALARRVPVRELLGSARAARRAGSARPLVEEAAGSASASRGEIEPGVVEEEDSDELLSEVRLELPVPMDVAVDETRDLHRAVAGRESNLASFVEALVGEAFAGPHPPDASLVPVGAGQLRAVREKLLAELHAGWKDLDEPGDRPSRAGARAERQATSSVTELDREMEQVLEQVVAMEGAVAWNVPSAVVAGWQLWDLVEIETRLEQLLGAGAPTTASVHSIG